MRVPDGIHVQWVEHEAVVLNERTGEVHYLNPQSALIYALLLEYGMPLAAEQAVERLNGPPEEISPEVDRLLSELVERGLLTETSD